MTAISKKLALILAFCVGVAFSAPVVMAADSTAPKKDTKPAVQPAAAAKPAVAPAAAAKPVAAPAAAAKPAAKPVAKKAAMQPVNINKATVAELKTLSGIGPKLAKKIVEYRTKNGAFKTVADLAKVKGVSKKVIEKNAKFLKIN